MPLDCVEGLCAADVRLSTALILGHELHEHSDQLMHCLVVYPCIFWEQVLDSIVILGRLLSCRYKISRQQAVPLSLVYIKIPLRQPFCFQKLLNGSFLGKKL